MNNPVALTDDVGMAAFANYDDGNLGNDLLMSLDGGACGGSGACGYGGGAITFPRSEGTLSGIETALSWLLSLLATAVTTITLSNIIAKRIQTEEKPFYGAVIEDGELLIITDPMSYSEAKVWVATVGASGEMCIGNRIEHIGPKRKWGLYTCYRVDAYNMAYELGGGIEPDEPEVSKNVPDALYHYHIAGREYGIYQHFHIWYGY